MTKKHLLLSIILIFALSSLSAEVYREKALVSYYAGDFHGKKTSNGEYFNMNDYTCANKSLPFNTILKVTNLSNGLSVQVRVNDRGPFVTGRELDLSKAAAQKIGMIKSGTTYVRIEIVKKGPDTKLSRQTAAKASQIMAKLSGGKVEKSGGVKTGGASSQSVKKTYQEGTFWDVQLGSFSTRENANELAQKLLKDGFTDVVFQKGNGIYRVVIRKVPAQKVSATEKKLKACGYSDYLIKQRKA
ncbi:MAG: septal ring lytic transglycosylase RlpA family protein [Treponema sp.]|nr:septal ring lytic transglycosylase RlpA family protein [Treponema sp.]